MLRILTFLALLLAPTISLAGHSKEAEDFIQNLADESVTILSNKDVADAVKIEQFDAILTRDVDMGRVGRFVLGRYWRGLKEDDLNAYLATYQDYLIHSNASRLSAYAGEKIKVTNSVPDARNQIIVKSEVERTDGGPAISIDWRLLDKDGELKVIDIIIEGISMALTQRDEFSSLMQRSGGKIDPLMVRMNKVIGETGS